MMIVDTFDPDVRAPELDWTRFPLNVLMDYSEAGEPGAVAELNRRFPR